MEDSTSSQEALNDTEDEFAEPCTFSTSNNVKRVLSIYIYPIICILGLVGNIAVILTLASRKEILKKTEVFQFNLAITNLLFIVALAFLIYNELFSWPMGQVACKLLQGSYSINLYSGILLVAAMSIVHYFAVHHPLLEKTSSHLLPHSIICVFIWVFAILVSVPTFYFYQFYELTSGETYLLESETENRTSASPLYSCDFQFEDSDLSRIVKVAVPSIQMAVGFFLPLLIIIFCYTSIIALLSRKNLSQTESKPFRKENLHTCYKMICQTNSKSCKKETQQAASNSMPNTGNDFSNEDKALKKVTGIMLVFVVCHTPYNLILLYDTIVMFQLMSCEEADSWNMALSVAESVAYLQCCLNPVMYGFMAENFRNKFKNIFSPSTRHKMGTH
ncbi:C-C chemokine receptor type 6-like [Anableps anableps]